MSLKQLASAWRLRTQPANPNTLRFQVPRFVVVGVWNTLLDYVLFISITKVFHIPLDRVWIAKVISGAVAIGNSFYFNRGWVFHGNSPVFHGNSPVFRQGAAFLVATLIGVYAVQTPLTHLFTSVFPAPGQLAFDAMRAVGLTSLVPSVLTEAFAIKTVAFVLATAASMTSNFVAYRYWVFGEWRET